MSGIFSLHIDAAHLSFKFPYAVYATVTFHAVKGPVGPIALNVHVELPAIVLRHLKDPAAIAREAELVANKRAMDCFEKENQPS